MGSTKSFKQLIFGILFVFILAACSETVTPTPQPQPQPPTQPEPEPEPEPVEEITGGVILSFDDRFIAEWTAADAALTALDWKATFYITQYQSLTAEEKSSLKALQAKGHDIGMHGVNHLDILEFLEGEPAAPEEPADPNAPAPEEPAEPDTAAPEEPTPPQPQQATERTIEDYIAIEILPQKTLMEQDGFAISSFAYPFGSRNDDTDKALLEYFDILRGTTYGEQAYAFAANVFAETPVVYGIGFDESYGNSLAYLLGALDYAKANDKIIIFYGQNIAAFITNKDYTTSLKRLEDFVVYANSIKVPFLTMKDLVTTP